MTREELVTRLMVKIGMELSPENLVRVVRDLRWESFGACVLITPDGYKRTVVGCGKPGDGRRDFIRLQGEVDNTALSVQVRLIVKYASLRTFIKIRSIAKYVIPLICLTYTFHTGLYVRKNIWFRSGEQHHSAQRVTTPQEKCNGCGLCSGAMVVTTPERNSQGR